MRISHLRLNPPRYRQRRGPLLNVPCADRSRVLLPQFDYLVLRGEFDIGIYNLNYDNVALMAVPRLFTGFDKRGRFDSASVHTRREWNFLSYRNRKRLRFPWSLHFEN